MSDRFVIKIAGSAGQGIKTSGMVIAKALKNAGFCTFGYTEYPSLIRGGHNVFQIDVSTDRFASVSNKLNVLLALDQNSIKIHAHEFTDKGVIVFDDAACKIDEDMKAEFEKKGVEVHAAALFKIAEGVGGSSIMKNTVTLGILWSILGLDIKYLNDIMREFFNKSDAILDLNLKCAAAGYTALKTKDKHFNVEPAKDTDYQNDMIISGNEAIGLGAIAGGVRLYSSYPMTPASSILSYLAAEGPKSGMIVKQAEDEITSASMVIGASFAGTRAMCGTSGGGFDLMSETLSLAGISETPFVAVLAQRPGPGTGAPTWTAQGDLNMALHTGHGEFPRILIGTGDTTDSFFLTIEAHNLAEKYQTPVIILTDKYLAESFYSTPAYDESQVKIDRGQMLKAVGEPDKTKLRYQITENGISDRWIPGDKIAPFLASSDEHTEKGYSTEEGDEIATMISKRLRKLETIRAALPEPEIFGANVEDADALVISWGSNKQPIIDVQKALAQDGVKIAYMHIKYLWPLKTEFLTETIKKAKKTICVEANSTGQLSNLIAFETKQELPNRILKFDGRPFFFEELINSIKNYL